MWLSGGTWLGGMVRGGMVGRWHGWVVAWLGSGMAAWWHGGVLLGRVVLCFYCVVCAIFWRCSVQFSAKIPDRSQRALRMRGALVAFERARRHSNTSKLWLEDGFSE